MSSVAYITGESRAAKAGMRGSRPRAALAVAAESAYSAAAAGSPSGSTTDVSRPARVIPAPTNITAR